MLLKEHLLQSMVRDELYRDIAIFWEGLEEGSRIELACGTCHQQYPAPISGCVVLSVCYHTIFSPSAIIVAGLWLHFVDYHACWKYQFAQCVELVLVT